jgi:hypothetical protein
MRRLSPNGEGNKSRTRPQERTAMSELKPCPFCGDEGDVGCYDKKSWTAECSNPDCFCSAENSFWDKESAEKVWNTRPLEAKLEQENAQLRESAEMHIADCNDMLKRLGRANEDNAQLRGLLEEFIKWYDQDEPNDEHLLDSWIKRTREALGKQ